MEGSDHLGIGIGFEILEHNLVDDEPHPVLAWDHCISRTVLNLLGIGSTTSPLPRFSFLAGEGSSLGCSGAASGARLLKFSLSLDDSTSAESSD
jgi:hypothetical protein